eukprot:CAMPEP_0171100624 /NCGR_PEP_ID=MMETSP0766_2-20121228/53066_1 /TAXON_ID=439317 /ORGANISM="Gambierdiscus australes, Strain CAWD 149" /LENGTH=152 /DNA_ID=CAMNT_0011560479 /DNA_START=56 /DNA_END=514 /DNA_ORIENTATION=-
MNLLDLVNSGAARAVVGPWRAPPRIVLKQGGDVAVANPCVNRHHDPCHEGLCQLHRTGCYRKDSDNLDPTQGFPRAAAGHAQHYAIVPPDKPLAVIEPLVVAGVHHNAFAITLVLHLNDKAGLQADGLTPEVGDKRVLQHHRHLQRQAADTP